MRMVKWGQLDRAEASTGYCRTLGAQIGARSRALSLGLARSCTEGSFDSPLQKMALICPCKDGLKHLAVASCINILGSLLWAFKTIQNGYPASKRDPHIQQISRRFCCKSVRWAHPPASH